MEACADMKLVRNLHKAYTHSLHADANQLFPQYCLKLMVFPSFDNIMQVCNVSTTLQKQYADDCKTEKVTISSHACNLISRLASAASKSKNAKDTCEPKPLHKTRCDESSENCEENKSCNPPLSLMERVLMALMSRHHATHLGVVLMDVRYNEVLASIKYKLQSSGKWSDAFVKNSNLERHSWQVHLSNWLNMFVENNALKPQSEQETTQILSWVTHFGCVLTQRNVERMMDVKRLDTSWCVSLVMANCKLLAQSVYIRHIDVVFGTCSQPRPVTKRRKKRDACITMCQPAVDHFAKRLSVFVLCSWLAKHSTTMDVHEIDRMLLHASDTCDMQFVSCVESFMELQTSCKSGECITPHIEHVLHYDVCKHVGNVLCVSTDMEIKTGECKHFHYEQYLQPKAKGPYPQVPMDSSYDDSASDNSSDDEELEKRYINHLRRIREFRRLVQESNRYEDDTKTNEEEDDEDDEDNEDNEDNEEEDNEDGEDDIERNKILKKEEEKRVVFEDYGDNEDNEDVYVIEDDDLAMQDDKYLRRDFAETRESNRIYRPNRTGDDTKTSALVHVFYHVMIPLTMSPLCVERACQLDIFSDHLMCSQFTESGIYWNQERTMLEHCVRLCLNNRRFESCLILLTRFKPMMSSDEKTYRGICASICNVVKQLTEGWLDPYLLKIVHVFIDDVEFANHWNLALLKNNALSPEEYVKILQATAQHEDMFFDRNNHRHRGWSLETKMNRLAKLDEALRYYSEHRGLLHEASTFMSTCMDHFVHVLNEDDDKVEFVLDKFVSYVKIPTSVKNLIKKGIWHISKVVILMRKYSKERIVLTRDHYAIKYLREIDEYERFDAYWDCEKVVVEHMLLEQSWIATDVVKHVLLQFLFDV